MGGLSIAVTGILYVFISPIVASLIPEIKIKVWIGFPSLFSCEKQAKSDLLCYN